MSSVVCAGLVACADTSERAAATVVRTPPPVGYEKTITNYLAFRIRGPQKNPELNFSPPEPAACALDGYAAGRRGWVVPVVYATRTGEATGRETIKINTKQYYFWFLGNTIAGITPRLESCPGMEASFGEVAPAGAGFAAPQPVVFPTPLRPVGRGEGADSPDLSASGRGADRASGSVEQKPAAAVVKKKTSKPSRQARRGTKNTAHTRAAPPKVEPDR